MRVIHFSMIFAVALIASDIVHAAEDYTFDLTKPPPYAKEWFAVASEDRAIQKAGPPVGFKKSRSYDLHRKMRPTPESPVDHWAAYHFSSQQSFLSRIPDADYLERLHKTKDTANSVRIIFHPWNFGGLMNDVSMSIDGWILSRPSVAPTTKPEEIKRLHRYIVKLTAEVLGELNARYLPDWNKRFAHHTTRTDDPWSDKPPVRSPEQEEALRLIRVDEEWKDGMMRIHTSFNSQLHFVRANLCGIFRAYMPGDKPAIREMLAIAGYKTPEQRKAYWQYCRTHGASWADWTPADEQRLVTE